MPHPFEALIHELIQARTLFDLSRVDIEVFKRGFADLGARLEKLEANAHPPIEVVTPDHLANLVGEISDIKDQVAEIKGTVAAMESGEWRTEHGDSVYPNKLTTEDRTAEDAENAKRQIAAEKAS